VAGLSSCVRGESMRRDRIEDQGCYDHGSPKSQETHCTDHADSPTARTGPSVSSVTSNSGSRASRIERSEMMQRLISGRDGISNIELSSDSSMIDLRARAPVPRSSASSAIASREPFWKTSSTLSSEKNFWYCRSE